MDLGVDEELIDYPDKVKMLNAIKVSGRTKMGLGVGFLNAITEKTYTTIKDSLTGQTRTELVEPLANYNVFVLDQQFNKNSSVSLINTNVTRNGHFRDANVTGLLASIKNRKNTYGVDAEIKMSSLNLIDGNQNGFSSEIEIGKISGNYQYEIEHKLVDKNYDINDLGINFRNNYSNLTGRFSYRIFKPTEKLNDFQINASAKYKRRHNPSTYQGNDINIDFFAQTKTLFAFGAELNTQIGKQYDYYESREDKVYINENWLGGNAFISSNYNKTFAIDARFRFGTLFEDGRDLLNLGFRMSPRIRFNDNFLFNYSFNYDDIKELGDM